MDASRVVLTGNVPETVTGAIVTASRGTDRRVVAPKDSRIANPEEIVRIVRIALIAPKERALLP
ncbi:MAG: hypothetical protein BWY82_00884 [Verrucomicrobia bacterium ADurb.Bin474]|nr:MAG: hypothetical protein BWY82_00884 [Verrucomicrobia bacterium ADurb.Bin474]